MREIKFRAWDKVNERMYPDGFSVSQDGKEVYDDNIHDIAYHLILMQYTGLKDKNGTEIYEGDIVRDVYSYSPEFSSELFKQEEEFVIETIYTPIERHAQMNSDPDFSDLANYYSKGVDEQGCEIIGNIYENPELLKSN